MQRRQSRQGIDRLGCCWPSRHGRRIDVCGIARNETARGWWIRDCARRVWKAFRFYLWLDSVSYRAHGFGSGARCRSRDFSEWSGWRGFKSPILWIHTPRRTRSVIWSPASRRTVSNHHYHGDQLRGGKSERWCCKRAHWLKDSGAACCGFRCLFLQRRRLGKSKPGEHGWRL